MQAPPSGHPAGGFQANGGDILFGERIRQMIESLWPVYDRGSIRLKGIEAPVQVFSLFKAGELA